MNTFKQRNSFQWRKEERKEFRHRHPNRILVIVERLSSQKSLPLIKRNRLFIPYDLQIMRFMAMMRERLQLHPSQAIYILVNNQTLPSMSKSMAEIYKEHQDEDSFFYFTYVSEDVFGLD